MAIQIFFLNLPFLMTLTGINRIDSISNKKFWGLFSEIIKSKITSLYDRVLA